MRHLFPAVATVLVLSAGAAYAEDDMCKGQGPMKTEAEVKAQFEGQGYQIRKFDMEDGCYEIKGTDAAGKKVEMYINPWTAEVVKTKTY